MSTIYVGNTVKGPKTVPKSAKKSAKKVSQNQKYCCRRGYISGPNKKVKKSHKANLSGGWEQCKGRKRTSWKPEIQILKF